MKPTLRPVRIAPLAAALLMAAIQPATAQLDTTHVPQPPTEQLAKLSRFLGTYVYTDNQYAGMGPWRGTLTVEPAIKNWYVQWTINTRYGPIDRQLTMLTTWDETLGHYRIWRFETVPPGKPGEGEGVGRWSGDEFIMEWKDTPGPDGQRSTFRNRIRMEGPDTLVIVSEADSPDGKGAPFRVGLWKSVRIQGGPGSGGLR